MKNKNHITLFLPDYTVTVLEALALRQQVSVDCIIERMIWDASRYAFTYKELLLLGEHMEVKE